MNDKAVPRPKALERIDDLYKEYSGEKRVPESVLAAKQGIIRGNPKKYTHSCILYPYIPLATKML